MNKLIVWLGIATAGIAGCSKKDSGGKNAAAELAAEGSAGSTGSAATGSGSATPAIGEAVMPAITKADAAGVAAAKSRLDDLAALLDKTSTVSAAIELLATFRKQDSWKQLAATSDKLAAIDGFIGTLGDGVTQLHAFQAGLKDASARLGNIKGELDSLLAQPAVAAKIADLKARITSEVTNAVTTVETQAVATIQKVLLPIRSQLSDLSDLIVGGCALAKVSGGGDQLKDLCAKAKDILGQANTFLAELDKKPGEVITQLTTQLQTSLNGFLDDQSKALLSTAQQTVNDALKLPAAPAAGSGSSAAAGTR